MDSASPEINPTPLRLVRKSPIVKSTGLAAGRPGADRGAAARSLDSSDVSELEVLQAVVLTHLTGGVGRVVAAPLEALADDLKTRVARTLARIGENAERKAGGEPLEANDRVLFKAL